MGTVSRLHKSAVPPCCMHTSMYMTDESPHSQKLQSGIHHDACTAALCTLCKPFASWIFDVNLNFASVDSEVYNDCAGLHCKTVLDSDHHWCFSGTESVIVVV